MAKPSTTSKKPQHLKLKGRKLQDELCYLAREFLSRLGKMLAQSARSPGRNTMLLPQGLLRLGLSGINYWRQRRRFARLRRRAALALAHEDWTEAYTLMMQCQMTFEARLELASMLPCLEYGSINEGVPGWDERWLDAPPQRRVLMVAPKDFAGSTYKLAEAVNRHTSYAVRLVTFEFHQFKYPVDLVVPECDDARLQAVLKLAGKAAILHLKDEHSWFLGWEQFPNLRLLNALFFADEFAHTCKVFTHYGGYARKLKQDARYMARVTQFDGRIAMTPDLNYDWFNGDYVPHAIDTDRITPSWRDSSILAHSPSTPATKATDMFEEAVALLKKYHQDVWRNWSVDIITGVSYEDCMTRKRKASLFFDQAGWHARGRLGIEDVIGWYGNSAVEAMAFGIPTMAHLSDVALVRAEKAGCSVADIPVINVPRTRDGLAEAILSFATQSPGEREALSERTRQFAVEFHGYNAVGKRMADVYDRLLSQHSTQHQS